MFLIEKDKNLIREVGSSEGDINRLNLDFKNILLEVNEDYLYHNKNQVESILEKFLNK